MHILLGYCTLLLSAWAFALPDGSDNAGLRQLCHEMTSSTLDPVVPAYGTLSNANTPLMPIPTSIEQGQSSFTTQDTHNSTILGTVSSIYSISTRQLISSTTTHTFSNAALSGSSQPQNPSTVVGMPTYSAQIISVETRTPNLSSTTAITELNNSSGTMDAGPFETVSAPFFSGNPSIIVTSNNNTISSSSPTSLLSVAKSLATAVPSSLKTTSSFVPPSGSITFIDTCSDITAASSSTSEFLQQDNTSIPVSMPTLTKPTKSSSSRSAGRTSLTSIQTVDESTSTFRFMGTFVNSTQDATKISQTVLQTLTQSVNKTHPSVLASMTPSNAAESNAPLSSPSEGPCSYGQEACEGSLAPFSSSDNVFTGTPSDAALSQTASWSQSTGPIAKSSISALTPTDGPLVSSASSLSFTSSSVLGDTASQHPTDDFPSYSVPLTPSTYGTFETLVRRKETPIA